MTSGHIKQNHETRLNKDHDVDEHILNISSYIQAFIFPKTCFVSKFEVLLAATHFYHGSPSYLRESQLELEPLLSDDKKKLAVAILRSIAPN